jgi:isopenicillin N synthase-like dioxygenase
MSIVDQKHDGGKGFSSVPTLDFALLDGEKDRFLAGLRHILVNVGFLYLANPPIDKVRVELKGACEG